ncbi:TetR/AcrR family transcriptional repressor of nem operon [Nitrobacteraceae bacterium AZCC 1564]
MARPKLFDRDEALQAAIRAFRNTGFAGTSTDDLLNAMGISRQSLYDTFGDKRALYLEALRQYNADSLSRSLRALHAAPSPREGLEALLMEFVSRATENGHCLGVSSIGEFGRGDDDICALNDTSGHVLTTAIRQAVEAGHASGQIPKSVSPKATAVFILTLLSGLKVLARGGASQNDLRDAVRVGLNSLG